jgi:hypothetical protein
MPDGIHATVNHMETAEPVHRTRLQLTPYLVVNCSRVWHSPSMPRET